MFGRTNYRQSLAHADSKDLHRRIVRAGILNATMDKEQSSVAYWRATFWSTIAGLAIYGAVVAIWRTF